jgi:centrin-3
VTEKLLSRDPLTDLRRAFKLFDVDGTGVINLRDLRRVAKELGENLGEEELYVKLRFSSFINLLGTRVGASSIFICLSLMEAYGERYGVKLTR